MKHILVCILLLFLSNAAFAFDQQTAVNNLLGGIKIKTIAQEKDNDSFLLFKNHLKKSYPLIFKNCEKKSFGDYSLLIKVQGCENKKQPIFLLGHFDTVGFNSDEWKYSPLGEIVNNKIYGRGTLDDKSSTFAMLEAVEDLLKNNYTPKNDIYILLGGDEETGGKLGAGNIVSFLAEKNIKPRLVLDEGEFIIKQKNIGIIGVSEKGIYKIRFEVKGDGGHAAYPSFNSPYKYTGELLKQLEGSQKPTKTNILFSRTQSEFIESYARKNNTLAVTMISGSDFSNQVPSVIKIVADVRLLPNQDISTITDKIDKIISAKDLKGHVSYKVEELTKPSPVSKTDSAEYSLLKNTIIESFPNTTVKNACTIGGTDSSKYYILTNNVYRFLPLSLNDEQIKLFHNKDEYIEINQYFNMIKFYKKLLVKFGE